MVEKITKWYVLLPYLNNYERHLLLRDFEEELKKSHQTLKKYIETLIKDKILIEVKRKKISTYSLNLENQLTYDYVSIGEKIKLKLSLEKSSILKRLYEILNSSFKISNFLVFGSFAKNLAGNDIDLLVIGKEDKNLQIAIKKFSNAYGIKIHKMQITQIKEINDAMAKEIYNKHIILNNSDFFVKFFGEKYGKA